ncbi:MAG: formate dehydrogenase accessory sulfurtransferase FdhD [Burkholderiaceae bacterium]
MTDAGAANDVANHAVEDTAGVERARVSRYRNGRVVVGDDWLVDEVPIALVFNGISHAVMLASPLQLEDFALGFALTEGLLADRSELYGVDVQAVANGIEVHLEVASACEFRMKQRRRNMSGRTGCGLCGTESLDQVLRIMPATRSTLSIETTAVSAALKAMASAQPLQRVSGAVHAAAWCDRHGRVELIREDVGRHNALDKLVGAMVVAEAKPDQGFIAVTSRASVEMVQKTLMAGVGLLIAVSAPTALAVRVAIDHGLALAGFARGDDLVCYTAPERFGLTPDILVAVR